MLEPYRVAVYYAPAPGDPLSALGSQWLGRDTVTGAVYPQPEFPDIAAQTSNPRRYGFHATLKPPMQLTGTFEKFLVDAERLASELKPCVFPRLSVNDIHGFVAICPETGSTELDHIAAACVMELDSYRVVEDETAQARRAGGRTESQLRNLARWGYPLVLEDWQFHMTLSNAGAGVALLPAARSWFKTALDMPRLMTSLAIFTESAPGADFRLAQRFKLGR